MDFSETFKKAQFVLKKIGSNINEDDYDGIIVKKLEASNTLDKGRTTKQSHIAITGAQMDMFPYVRADGYFEVDYSKEDNELKKYFVAQIPVYLHKENISYLDPNTELFKEDEKKVYISIVRSRRNGAADQLQMSMTYMDTPVYIDYRHIVHSGSYMIMLKRKEKLVYDMYSVKSDDSEVDGVSLATINNCFEKIASNTVVHLDEFLQSEIENKEPVYFTGILPEIERNRIVFGAPGTGKSWKLKNDSTKLLEGTNGTLERVTFHPDYSYAQFVGTYKPISDNNGDIRYEFVAGPFMRVYVDAIKSGRTENPQPHILLIEEINRANVAAVFGDVFQLLDRGDDGVSEYEIQASQDVRKYLAKELGGQPEQWNRIKLPDNMFIWATMNSADQGVYPMDTAFKRRWDFTYLGIDDSDEDIRGKYVTVGNKEKQRIEWNELRKAINEFLADDLKINEDKLLGPYFISRNIVVPVGDNSEIDSKKFSDVFKNKVLMYLFEDAAKQKRPTLFEGSAKGYNRYSKICEAFDEQGIGIFNSKIQNRVKVQDLMTNGYGLDENGMVKTDE